MKIVLLTHAVFPIAEPFAGGLEMITYQIVRELQRRGHDVTLFAHADSDPTLPLIPLPTADAILANVTDGELESEQFSATEFIYQEQYAYAMARLATMDFDVFHNHSLHQLPILMGERYGPRCITTLHAPTGPRFKLAFRIADPLRQTLVCVSDHQRRYWEAFTTVDEVIHNGVALDNWLPSDEIGDYFFWMGRICPDKAPGDAVQACVRNGQKLLLAGPVHDQAYHDKHVAPYLDGDQIIYLGHLTHAEIAPRLARAKAMLFTSVYDEPYGLTMAESLAAGTPVIGYNSGAAPEIITPEVGFLVAKHDIAGLVDAMNKLATINRAACLKYAVNNCSVAAMVAGYERLYEAAVR